jgi:AraC-like DNA-binding protein
MKALKRASADAGLTPVSWESVCRFAHIHDTYHEELRVARIYVVQVLRAMIERGTSLRKLAADLNVSPTYLSMVTRQVTKCCPALIIRVADRLKRTREEGA